MASLSRIRAALGDHLDRITKLSVEPGLVETMTIGEGGGAVVGGPTNEDYYAAMGRGLTTWSIPIYLLASTANYGAATDLLDELVNPSGTRSVPQMLWDYGRAGGLLGQGLGVVDENGLVDLDIRSAQLTAYGVEFPNAGQPHIAAVITCEAHTDARLP